MYEFRPKTELAALRRGYKSDSDFAKAIAKLQGFENTSRQLVGNWLSEESESVSKGAVDVLRLLSQAKAFASISVAYGKSIWSVPILASAAQESQLPKWPKRVFLSNAKCGVEFLEVKTGGQALDILEAGRVNVAVAATHLFSRHHKCRPICSFVSGAVGAIVLFDSLPKKRRNNRQMRDDFDDLAGLRFGFLANSAAGPMACQRLQDNGVNVQAPIPFNDIDEVVHAIQRKEESGKPNIDGFIGWEPSLSQIDQKLGRASETLKFEDVSLATLCRVELSVGVNVETRPNPRALRMLLTSLMDSTKYINSNSDSDELVNDIRMLIPNEDMSRDDVIASVEASRFGIDPRIALLLDLFSMEQHEPMSDLR